MSFLKLRPSMRLMESDKQSKYTCFAADLHKEPVPRDDIDFNTPVFKGFEQHAAKYMRHTTCRLDFVAVVADLEGVMLVVHHSVKDNVYNTRRMILNMFAGLPEKT